MNCFIAFAILIWGMKQAAAYWQQPATTTSLLGFNYAANVCWSHGLETGAIKGGLPVMH